MTVAARRSAGDDRAFERLYRGHARAVFRYALAVLGDPADAEDVTQTTFLNAYRAFQRGERPRKPEHWLIAIAHNACRQRFRQAKSRPREVAFDEELDGMTVGGDDAAPTAEELRRAFLQLPPSQRAALAMRELDGRSGADIAEVLGISVSALETLLFRARRTLREQLEEQLTCREAAFAISKQLDGTVSLGDRLGLRAHVRRCPECARLARSLRAQRKALRRLLTVPLPPSLATFFGRSQGVTAGASSAGGFGAAGLAVKVAAFAAAGAVVGGGGYVGATHLSKHRSQRPAISLRRRVATQRYAPVRADSQGPTLSGLSGTPLLDAPGGGPAGQADRTGAPAVTAPPAVAVVGSPSSGGSANAANPSIGGHGQGAVHAAAAAAGRNGAANASDGKGGGSANRRKQHAPPTTPSGQNGREVNAISPSAVATGQGVAHAATPANGSNGPPATPPGQAKKAAAAAPPSPPGQGNAVPTAQADANASGQGAAHGRAQP